MKKWTYRHSQYISNGTSGIHYALSYNNLLGNQVDIHRLTAATQQDKRHTDLDQDHCTFYSSCSIFHNFLYLCSNQWRMKSGILHFAATTKIYIFICQLFPDYKNLILCFSEYQQFNWQTNTLMEVTNWHSCQ